MEKKAKPKKTKSEKISQEEFEKKVLKFAEEGNTAEKIGEKLRRGGIHPKEYNKKIAEILKEKKVYVNPDLKNVEEKLERIKKHYEKHKQDKRAMRDKDKIFAKLRRVKKYFGIEIIKI